MTPLGPVTKLAKGLSLLAWDGGMAGGGQIHPNTPHYTPHPLPGRSLRAKASLPGRSPPYAVHPRPPDAVHLRPRVRRQTRPAA